jgi:uncharacterized protein DUF4279
VDKIQSDYDDEYATCAETFVTLRILHPDLDPCVITAELGIEPSEAQKAGGVRRVGTGQPAAGGIGRWLLSSSGAVESRDVRRHLDWLLDRLEPKAEVLASLQSRGFRVDVPCYWLSATGQGGPTLSAASMARLGSLGLDVWFDVYFFDDGAPEA